MTPTLSPSRPPASAMRLPGGHTQPVWSSAVAATVDTGYAMPSSGATDLETTRPLGIWWVTWYALPPPAVATHCRSCTTTPCNGLATQLAAPSVERETVALPSHRSVMYSAP